MLKITTSLDAKGCENIKSQDREPLLSSLVMKILFLSSALIVSFSDCQRPFALRFLHRDIPCLTNRSTHQRQPALSQQQYTVPLAGLRTNLQDGAFHKRFVPFSLRPGTM
jgi:hypothetical protein